MAATQSGFAPYKNEAFNYIYNLLFCDHLEFYVTEEVKKNPQGPWKELCSEPADVAGLRALANDASQESRLRALAFNRLRAMGEQVQPKILLGAIIEVGLDNGLDVLAAYADHRARYINAVEKMSVFEPAPEALVPKIDKLLKISQTIVNQLGPWDKPRLARPNTGSIRMSFLVSDGLYFGQGDLNVMQKDALGGPIIAASLELLNAIVDFASKNSGKK